MKKDEKYIDLIDRYLQDKLTTEDRIEFNKMLESDPSFEKYFFEMDQLVSGIRFSARTSTVDEKLEKLAESLPFLEQAYSLERKPSFILAKFSEKFNEMIDHLSLQWSLSVRQTKLAMSGAFVTVVSVITVFMNILMNPSPQAIFVSNFNPPSFTHFSTQRSAENESMTPEIRRFEEAMLNYNSGNYQESEAILSTIPEEHMNLEMKLYKAIVFMRTENFNGAITLLNVVKDSEDTYYINQAKWYLALCRIRDKNYKEARQLLENVQEYGNNHDEDAGKLLKKLK